jgi:hypothetical protein
MTPDALALIAQRLVHARRTDYAVALGMNLMMLIEVSIAIRPVQSSRRKNGVP